MADTKLSALATPTGGLAAADLLYTVDVSDTTDSAAGSSRKTTVADVVAAGAARGCGLSHSANQTAGTGAWGVSAFDTEGWDTDAFHSTSSNTSRVTVPTGLGGKYMLTGSAEWATNATGLRGLRFLKNGTTVVGVILVAANTGAGTNLSHAAVADLAAGDYVEIQTYQSSGGNLTLNASAGVSPLFTATRLGG